MKVLSCKISRTLMFFTFCCLARRVKPDKKIMRKTEMNYFSDINLINFIISKPSKMHQTGDEDQAMQKGLSMSLESHRREEDKKKQKNTSFNEKGQSTNSRQPCPPVSPQAKVSGNISEV